MLVQLREPKEVAELQLQLQLHQKLRLANQELLLGLRVLVVEMEADYQELVPAVAAAVLHIG